MKTTAFKTYAPFFFAKICGGFTLTEGQVPTKPLYHFPSNITKDSWAETRKVTQPLPSWAKQTLIGEIGDLKN